MGGVPKYRNSDGDWWIWGWQNSETPYQWLVSPTSEVGDTTTSIGWYGNNKQLTPDTTYFPMEDVSGDLTVSTPS